MSKRYPPPPQVKSEAQKPIRLPYSTPISYAGPQKVAIVGMEVEVELVAQYNPKELQFEKTAGWTSHDERKHDGPDLEYTSTPRRTLSMELLFDGYEGDEDVSQIYVAKLMQLISVMDPDGPEVRKRPSIVQVVWPYKGDSKFQGVLQSVSTKYTMFNPDGKPVRATCAIKVLEVTNLRELLLTDKISPRGQNGW